MISIPTVLVLGAGASAHLDFPLGGELFVRVCEALDGNRRPPSNIGEHTLEYEELLSTTDNPSALDEFRDELLRSGVRSVDEFLESRTEFETLGKQAIAQQLLKFENPQTLHDPKRENWYKSLWAIIRASFDDCVNGKLAFVTFNYDRSLDQFLCDAIQAFFRKNRAEAGEIMQKLRLIHIHGQLGKLPWQSRGKEPGPRSGARPYETKAGPDVLRGCAKTMNLVHQMGDEDGNRRAATELLSLADRILFLGFAYNETNMKKLLPDQTMRGKKQVLGTCQNLTETRLFHLHQNYPYLKLVPKKVGSFVDSVTIY